MNYDTSVKKRGFIALMATIIISLILLVMVVEEGTSGWYARFNILGTEAKEQASSLAEGCADQALAALVTDPSYTGDSTSTTQGGTCYTFPVQLNTPAAGLVTINTQAEVRGSFANLAAVMDMASVHLGSTPALPTRGTLIVYTHVINDNGGAQTAAGFTENVAATAPSKFLFAGSEGGIAVTMDPGAYSVSQNPLSGYSQSLSAGCSGTIAAGDVKACVVTNDDVLTTLTVIANVINDNGGVHPVGDFVLYIDGVAKTAGQPYVVAAGPHTVSGTTFAGYTASAWGYNCAANGSITINTGDNKTCIITYDDNAPAAPSCADTVMMLDRTGSMASADLAGEKTAANALVSLYAGVLPPSPLPHLAVGSFGGLDGSHASVPALGELTTLYSNITTQITQMMNGNSSVGTDLYAAINAGAAELNSARYTAGNAKVLIIVSDGDPSEPTSGSAASSGFFSPTANVQNASGDLWSNPTGAYAGGGTDASDSVSGSNRHRFYNFNFPTLPTGAVITGIEAMADAWATTTTLVATPASSQKPPSAVMASPNNQWTGGANAFASDNVYATDATNGHVQGFSNFGFSIPSNATITGVQVTTEAKVSGGTASTNTATLTPIGQGNDTSWNGTESDVDETGTVSCASNDNINSNVNGNRESVLINLSSIPNGSTVTSVQVLTWDEGSSGGQYQDFARVDGGTRTNSGTITVTSTSGCNARTQTIDIPDFVKASGDTFEVGVQKVGNTNVIVGAIRAVITYLPPATGSVTTALSSNNGTSWTAAKTTALDATESVDAPSGNSATDLWGRAWTPANFANGNFAVRITNTSTTGTTVSLDQVLVTVNYTVPAPSTNLACQLGMDLSWNGGSTWTTEKTQTLTGTDATYTLGSASDDWSSSHTWATGDFTNANFRARVQAIDPGSGCDNASVDHLDWLRMQLDYTIPATPQEAALNAADAAKLAGTNIFTIYFGSGDPTLLAELASGSTPVPGHQPGSYADPGGVSNGSLTSSPTAAIAPNQFANPTRAFASDNSYTTDTTNGHQQGFGGFAFNLPPGAAVTGVEVDTEAKSTDTNGCQVGAEVSYNGGSSWTATGNKFTITSGSDTVYVLGGSAVTWGHSWAAGDFAAGNFAVRLSDIDPGSACTNGSTLSVDHVQTKVYYTVNAENDDGDDYFVAPTSADMAGIFNFIGAQVCPAASAPAATPPPTTATLLISTVVTNDSGTGSKAPSDFTTNVSATNASQTNFAGSSGTTVTVDPGDYSVTEVGVSGYTERPSATCSSALAGTIAAGETRSCVLSNDDIPPPPPPPDLTITTGSFNEVPTSP